jgi:hypothetical protein
MDSLYKEENLAGKDKYTYYLDGNHGTRKSRLPSTTEKKLSLLKIPMHISLCHTWHRNIVKLI